MEAGSIICSIKRLCIYLWGTNFTKYLDHKSLEGLEKDRRTQPASTAVDTIPYRVQLHPRMSQMQCQRKRRVSLPPSFACDRARPQGPLQSYSVRGRTRLLHPLVGLTSRRTLHRACLFGSAGALRPLSSARRSGQEDFQSGTPPVSLASCSISTFFRACVITE